MVVGLPEVSSHMIPQNMRFFSLSLRVSIFNHNQICIKVVINCVLWWHISAPHLSDNYVDLSDNYVDLSDDYVDLSDLFVDLSPVRF
jgi:hypothetical protein